jgi:hypothetical protein
MNKMLNICNLQDYFDAQMKKDTSLYQKNVQIFVRLNFFPIFFFKLVSKLVFLSHKFILILG